MDLILDTKSGVHSSVAKYLTEHFGVTCEVLCNHVEVVIRVTNYKPDQALEICSAADAYAHGWDARNVAHVRFYPN